MRQPARKVPSAIVRPHGARAGELKLVTLATTCTAAFKFPSGIQKEKGPQKAGALAIVGMLHAGAQCL